MRKLNYDSKHDILLVKFSDLKNSYSDEDESGIVVHRDIVSDVLTGITIFNFAARLDGRSEEPIKLPEGLSFQCDILPYIH